MNENKSESHSIIKKSFDKLINQYHYKESDYKAELDIELKSSDKISINKHKSNTEYSSDFIRENFCNKECLNKFNKVINLLKDGKIDINKIDWSQQSDTNSINIIQNLVNYYYNIGYQQANNNIINNSSDLNKNTTNNN